MQYLIKLHSEITIKSRVVRKQMILQLKRNCRLALKKIDESVLVTSHWDKIMVDTKKASEENTQKIIQKLQKIPGIFRILEVTPYPLGDFDDILEKTLFHYKESLQGKTFCVRVKRCGVHNFRSIDLERYLGGGILAAVKKSKVNLHAPGITVTLEVKDDTVYVISNSYSGLAGFPVGVQPRALSLISGGYDSSVSSFLAMKKGLKIDYLFFNLGGEEHELGVKGVAHLLSEEFSDGYNGSFILIDFQEVVKELSKVREKYRGVILKRKMFQAANMLVEEYGYTALITGDSIGQVSSQTLVNLNIVSSATPHLIIRPLITMDKNDIINISKEIGTEYICKGIQEYCAIVPTNPSTAAKMEKIQKEESFFCDDVIEDAFDLRKSTKLKDLMTEEKVKIEFCDTVKKNEIIIDIRDFSDGNNQLLDYKDVEILQIPFYEIKNKSKKLLKKQTYVLYCDKGIMSKMYALHLTKKGFHVKILINS